MRFEVRLVRRQRIVVFDRQHDRAGGTVAGDRLRPRSITSLNRVLAS